MKYNLLLFCMLLYSLTSSAQSSRRGICMYAESNSSIEVCKYMQQNSFQSEKDAKEAIEKLLKPISLKPNFVAVPCNDIQNCAALTWSDGLRYIVYDKEFMKKISSAANTDWTSMSIFAHEIGHHLNGHTLIRVTLSERRQEELEADEFSGFLMARLGATLDQAQAAMKTIQHPSCSGEIYSDHPCLEKRLEYIKRGWNNTKGKTEEFEWKGNYKSKVTSSTVQEFGGNKSGINYCFYTCTYSNLSINIDLTNRSSDFQTTYSEKGLYGCTLPTFETQSCNGKATYFSLDKSLKKVTIIYAVYFPLLKTAKFEGTFNDDGIIDGTLTITRPDYNAFKGYSLDIPMIVRKE